MTCLSVLLFIFVPKMLYLRSKKKTGDTRVTINGRVGQSVYNNDRDSGMRLNLQISSEDFHATLNSLEQTTCSFCKIKQSADFLKSKITGGLDNNCNSKQEDDNVAPDFSP